MTSTNQLSDSLRQYALITGNYWAFTLTDGALRMLVVLHFHQLGYSPFSIAMLFLFYEVFGIVTNLIGGWLGAILGLNKIMNIGLCVQILALGMLVVPDEHLTVAWVMFAQALSGIAKDLNKMSAKSAIKLLVPQSEDNSKLYHWVTLLTGSKNTLKGFGFFMGAGLLNTLGFQVAAASMAGILLLVLIISLINLNKDLGKAKTKPKFKQLLSKKSSINLLSSARLFLFGARDIWFVVALPVYFSQVLQWTHWQVGVFMACWVIGYGLVQSQAPKITGALVNGKTALIWAIILTSVTALLALMLDHTQLNVELLLLTGLILFGLVFAINSSVHSYLIVDYANAESVSTDVGFYYMTNAAGRLVGTILSGWVYQQSGLQACLYLSALFTILTSFI